MDSKNRWFWNLLAKIQTPYGLCAALIYLELSVPPMLRHLKIMADMSVGGYDIASYSAILLNGGTALALFLLILRQQIQHYTTISKPPLHERLFHRIKSRSNMVLILMLTACFLLCTVLVQATWTLVFHATTLLFAIVWNREASRAAERRVYNLLQKVPRRGAEATALLFFSKMWSGAVVMLIAVEAQTWVIWAITHSLEGTIGVVGFSSLMVGMFFGLLMFASWRVAKRLGSGSDPEFRGHPH